MTGFEKARENGEVKGALGRAKEVGVVQRLTPSSVCDTSTPTLTDACRFFTKGSKNNHLNTSVVRLCMHVYISNGKKKKKSLSLCVSD